MVRVALAALVSLVALIAVGLGALAAPSEPAQEGPTFFVNTTMDAVISPDHCLPGALCPLRSALQFAVEQTGSVRAAFCGAGHEPPCLAESDRNYDQGRGQWRLPVQIEYAYIMTGTNVTVDFARDVAGWQGPSDNRIVIDLGAEGFPWAIAVEGDGHVLTGFDVRGKVGIAAVIVRLGAAGNQIGPGLVLGDLDGGGAIQLRDTGTTANRVVGNWCGVRGDGTEVAPVTGSCVELTLSASGNVVGGPSPSDRNVLSGGGRAGVLVTGASTRDNLIQGNLIGLDAAGAAPIGHEVGVRIEDDASLNVVLGNVISGSRSHGIAVDDRTVQTRIEGNVIGADPTGQRPAPNGGYGIELRGRVRNTMIRRNRLAYNATGGVRIGGTNTAENTVTENSITGNNGNAIDIGENANDRIGAPRVSGANSTQVNGLACARCRVEIFSDPGSEADVFEGAAVAGPTGFFMFSKPEGVTHANVTASTTHTEGSTSPLSEPYSVGVPDTPVPPPIASPTAPPTVAPGTYPAWVHLPFVARGARR